MTDPDKLHAPRRTPASPDSPAMLATIGRELLEQAHELDAGRAAKTLTPGAGGALKQTVLALTEGTQLEEHKTPGPATIQVLSGEVRLGASSGAVELEAGQWAPIPDELHDLVATSDATVLLTVASTKG